MRSAKAPHTNNSTILGYVLPPYNKMPVTRRQAKSASALNSLRAASLSSTTIHAVKSKPRLFDNITTAHITKPEPALSKILPKKEPDLVKITIPLTLRIRSQQNDDDLPSRKKLRYTKRQAHPPKSEAKDIKFINDEIETKQYKLEKISDKDELYVPDIEDEPAVTYKVAPPTEEQAHQVTQILRRYYNRPLSTSTHPKTKPRKALLDSLIATILSQATTNTNSSRAFKSLKSAFPEWQQALEAGPLEIEEQIRCGGLAPAKSKVIHQILKRLKEERGECSLDYVKNMSDEQAKKEMCSFKGVGPKTASCVLMFGMQRQDFPVDTHVRRLAGRLGWMPLGSTAEKTYQVLNECLPGEIKYELHVLLIEHGRKTCKARDTRCDKCPLADQCPSYNGELVDSKIEPEQVE